MSGSTANQVQLGYDPASGRDLTGFGVEALDGSIGKIDAATNDVGESFVIVDTGPWIFGKKVMLPAGVVQRIDEEEEKVWVNRTKDQIKNAPEYDEMDTADNGYRQELGSYYGPVAPATGTGTTRCSHTRRDEPGRPVARTRAGRVDLRVLLAKRSPRIATSGAGRPVQRSKAAAPWKSSTSRPSTTTSQPAARAAATRAVVAAVGKVGEIDDLLPGSRARRAARPSPASC